VHARPVVYLINLLSFGVLETPALYTRCNNGIHVSTLGFGLVNLGITN
jgi:hypothetical protein